MSVSFILPENRPAKTYDQKVADNLYAALPAMESYLVGDDPILAVRGLTLRPSDTGGWLAVLKLGTKPGVDAQTLGENIPAGDYVAFGFGDGPLEALADVESRFADGTVNLSPDKFSQTPGIAVKAPNSAKARRNRKPVIK